MRQSLSEKANQWSELWTQVMEKACFVSLVLLQLLTPVWHRSVTQEEGIRVRGILLKGLYRVSDQA